jgi:phenylacetate-CoA ligase
MSDDSGGASGARGTDDIGREAIVALQLERLGQLLPHVQATSEFYRSRFRAAGVDLDRITSLDDMRRLPLVHKDDFIADQMDDPPYGSRNALAVGQRAQMFVYTTSGTSGRGQEVHVQTARELEGSYEVYRFMFDWAGIRTGDHVSLVMPLTMLSGGRIEYLAANSYGLTVYPLGNYDAAEKIAMMARFRAGSIIGTTSYLGRLGRLAEKRSDLHVNAVFSGAEGTGVSLLLRLQEMWGARVYDRYGSSQVGLDHMFSCEEGVGVRDRPGMLHNIDSHLLLEVLDPDTGASVADGEEGEIVVTSLYRADTPVIRCHTGDRGVFRSSRYCACGRPFDGLEIASIARIDDAKKIKGINVWPQAIDDVIFRLPEVADYRVTLSSSPEGLEVITVQIAPTAEGRPESEGALARKVADLLYRTTGLHADVGLVELGDLTVSDWKARRWLDLRENAAGDSRSRDAGSR